LGVCGVSCAIDVPSSEPERGRNDENPNEIGQFRAFDLQIEVPAVSAADLVLPAPTEGSAEVRARVTGARERQQTRFAALGVRSVRTNSACSGALLEQVAMPDEAGVALLRQASEALQLSARGFHRTLRVARTLADLDDTEHVSRAHVAEALSYRGEALRRQRAA
jgi:magnesium chelatase family protein